MKETSTSIAKEIAERESNLERLSTVRRDANARIVEIAKQRKSILADALTGNADARRELERLNSEAQCAATDLSDAADAMDHVEQQIARLRVSLRSAEKCEQGRRTIKAIKARIEEGLEARAIGAAREAEATLSKIEQSDSQLVQMLAKFDSNLCNQARGFLFKNPDRFFRVDFGSRPDLTSNEADSSISALHQVVRAIEQVIGEEDSAAA